MVDFYTPQVEPRRSTDALRQADPDAFGAGLGTAITRASDQVGDAAERARALEEQRDADVEATRLGRDLSQIELDAPELIDPLRNTSPADGAGHAQRVEEALRPRFEALSNSVTSDRNRELFARASDQLHTRLIGRERGWAQGQRAGAQATNAAEMARIQREVASRGFDHNQMMGALYTIGTVGAGMSALPESLRDRFVREESRGVIVAGLNALQVQNPTALQQALEAGTYGAWLTDADVATLRSGAAVEVRREESAARAQAAEQRGVALNELEQLEAMDEAGVTLTPAQRERGTALAQAVGEPARQTRWASRLVENDVNRLTEGWSPQQLEAERLRLRGLGARRTALQDMQLHRLEEIYPRRQAEFRSDLPARAASAGMPMPEVNLEEPRTFAALQRWRQQVHARWGIMPEPLTPVQVQSLAGQVSGGAAARLQLTRALRAGGGGFAVDAARQLAPEDRALLAATQLSDRYATWVLNGAAARQGSQRINTAESLRLFSRYRSSLPPEIQNHVLETARDIMAARMAEQGEAEWNAETAERAFPLAVHMALGGGSRDGRMTGGVQQVGPHMVRLPEQMMAAAAEARIYRSDDAAFRRFGNGAPATETGRPVPAALLRTLRPIAVDTARGIRLRFMNRAGDFVLTAAGDVYELDIGRMPPPPALPSPQPGSHQPGFVW